MVIMLAATILACLYYFKQQTIKALSCNDNLFIYTLIFFISLSKTTQYTIAAITL